MKEETKRKISATLKKKIKDGLIKLPWKGKVRSKEHSKKISEHHKGKHYSIKTEWKKGDPRISGKNSYMKNPRIIKKVQATRKLKIKEIGRNISKSRKGKINNHIGEKHWNWQGGKSFELYPLEFKIIKKLVVATYRGTCQLCNKPGKDTHHIDYNNKIKY